NFRQFLEPPLADLRTAARLIEVHDQIGFLRLEVRRRVVECQMAVLADTDERHVDGGSEKRRRVVAEDCVQIGVAVEEVKADDPGFVDQMLPKESSKACRVGCWKTDVLIEVKHFNLLPI